MKQIYLVALFLFFTIPVFSTTPLTGVSQVGTTNSIRLTWGETDVNLSSPDVSLNRYQISYGEIGQTPTIIDDISSTLREYTVTGLSFGKTYEVKIIEVIRVNIPPNPFTPPYIDNFNPSSPLSVTVVVGNLPPVARCQNITKSAGSDCSITITASEINNGSSDPENGMLTYSLNTSGPFGIGTHTVTLMVTDIGGLSSTCNATITITDGTPPEIQVKDATIFLDVNGAASITLNDVAVGFSDACGTVSNVSIDKTTFGCGDLGEQNVTLTVTDNAGNVARKTVKVTVKDNIVPVIFIPAQTYQLAANGTATLRDDTMRRSIVDNCGVTEVRASKITFDKNDIGTNEVLVTAKDASGNEAAQTIFVTIVDATPPTVNVKDAIIYLNAAGGATLRIEDVNNGSTDNVGIGDLQLSRTEFDCTNIGDNVVSLYVWDVSGNFSVATPKVTVVDSISPTVNVKPTVLPLDASGKAILSVPMIEELLADNCIITEVRFSQAEFSKDDLGERKIQIFVTDGGGNQTVADVMLTVVDITAPVVSAQDITLFADASRTADLLISEVTATIIEAVGLDSTYLSQSNFVCEGDTTIFKVLLTAIDKSRNVGVDTFTVTVCDTLSNRTLRSGEVLEGRGNAVDFTSKSAKTISAESEWTEEPMGEFYTFGPNPTDGEVRVFFKSSLAILPSVSLTNLSGRTVHLSDKPQLINDQTLRLNLESCNAGIYLLSIRQGLQVKTVKIVKE